MRDENGVEIRRGDYAIGVTGTANDAKIYEGRIVAVSHARMQAKIAVTKTTQEVWVDHDRMAVQISESDERWATAYHG